MADTFSRGALKVAIAQICQGLGWHAMQSSPCDILVDILQRYIEKTGHLSSSYAAHFGRTHVDLNDLALAFQTMGFNAYEMGNYIRDVEPVPFAHDVPAFPLPRRNNLRHPPPGSRHCRERLASIPEYMPPLEGVKEDFTPVHDRRDSLFSSMDLDSPELTSPSGQDGQERKGEKRSPEYVDYSIKRFRLDSEGNLQEVFMGDKDKRRVGTLPQAVTPPRRIATPSEPRPAMTPKLSTTGKSAVMQGLAMARMGPGSKPKSPKQQRYGTQETKAPRMRMPSSSKSAKASSQTKSPKHHLFSPDGPSKYSVKPKTPANVGVLPQPNQAVEFQPAKKGGKGKRPNGGAISTLLSAAMKIEDDEDVCSDPPPVKKKDSALSIYDFDEDFEGKGKGNLTPKEDGTKSPITSGESRLDPNSPRVFEEYEIIRTTCDDPKEPKASAKKKEKVGKLKKKKEKVEEKPKKKKKKGKPPEIPLFFADSPKKKNVMDTNTVKEEPLSDNEAKSPLTPAPTSPPPSKKKLKPAKLSLKNFVKEESRDVYEPVVTTPKIVIKKSGDDKLTSKRLSKSPVPLHSNKKLDKWRKKKFKKDKYKIKMGLASEQPGKSLLKLGGSPVKKGKKVKKAMKKLNIVKTSGGSPFQIKISSPKMDLEKETEPLSSPPASPPPSSPPPSPSPSPPPPSPPPASPPSSPPALSPPPASPPPPSPSPPPPSPPPPSPPPPPVKEKTKKKKKSKEAKTDSPKPGTKEQKPIKTESKTPIISVPKITLKMGGGSSDGKFIIKTVRPPSPGPISSERDSSPPSSPISQPPVPKISIPVLPEKKPTKAPATPKRVSKPPVIKNPLKVKESSFFMDTLPPPIKTLKKNKASAKAGKGLGDSPSSPRGYAGRGKKDPEITPAKKTSPKVAVKVTTPSSVVKDRPVGRPPKQKGSPVGGGTPGRGRGRPPKDPVKTEDKSAVRKEKPVKKEKIAPPPMSDEEEESLHIKTKHVGSYVNEQGEKVWICPGCGKPDDGSPMVGCDECDDWYHWPCVGIVCEPSEDDWYCDRCLAIRSKAKGKKRGRKKKSDA